MAVGDRSRESAVRSFEDLLYGIVAGIVLTRVVEFRFWEMPSLSAVQNVVLILFALLYLWGIAKLTLYWLGSKEDAVAVIKYLDHSIGLLDYLGGVFMALLLGLLPSAAVVNSGDMANWATKFTFFLVAYTVAGAIDCLIGFYLYPGLKKRLSEARHHTEVADALGVHLLRMRNAWVFPAVSWALCWIAWLAADARGFPLAGLIVAVVLIPAESVIEERYLWRSRDWVRDAARKMGDAAH